MQIASLSGKTNFNVVFFVAVKKQCNERLKDLQGLAQNWLSNEAIYRYW